MRIGIFTEVYPPLISGVVTSIKVLETALRNMHHEVFIVTANLEKTQFKYDEENKVIYLPGVKTGIYGTRLTSIYSKKAMKIIQSWNLDVIHSQTEFGVGMFSRIVAKKLNIPIVHTYHTLYEDYVYYVTHGYFDNLGKKLAIKLTKYFCETKCDELIVPTEKIQDLFVNKYGITKKANVIPTGIDTESFKLNPNMQKQLQKLKKQYHITKEDFVIGSLSRLAKEKSLDRLIKSVNHLVKNNPHIKLLIVGDGPAKKEIESLIQKLNLTNNVILTGKVEYYLVPTYYHLMNIFASFSTTETQGLTIIEALASSIPTICIADPSYNEMITSGYNGYLFQDEEDFNNYILKLIASPEIYQELSMNAENSIYKYSKEVFAAECLKVYSTAIANKK